MRMRLWGRRRAIVCRQAVELMAGYLDGALSLTCEDPRLGPHLAPVVGGLTGHKYVHIQGRGHLLSSLAEENATMYATFDIEQTQQVLEHMANALAGPVHRR